MEYIIYRILNLTNRKFYIGKTRTSLLKRWSVHLSHAKYGQKYTKKYNKRCGVTYLYNAMRKYGINNFEIKQIDLAKNYEHSRFLESFYIKYYNSHNSKYGYNLKIEAENDLEFIADHTKDLLRLSTYKQKMNKFRGVSWDKCRNKWVIRFTYDQFVFNKRFEKREEAEECRDLLSLYFYKENAILLRPNNIGLYKKNLDFFIKKLFTKRVSKNKYLGVKECNGKFIVRISTGKNNRIYFGCYDKEIEAAEVRDKVVYYLFGNNKNFNFPELINENYIKEGKDIVEKYSNRKIPKFLKKKKSSIYFGVSKRSTNTWEMSVKINKRRIRMYFSDEQEAAKYYDKLCVENNINLNFLNFP